MGRKSNLPFDYHSRQPCDDEAQPQPRNTMTTTPSPRSLRFILAALVLTGACGGDEYVNPTTQPTKQDLFDVLRKAHTSLEAKNYPIAAASFVTFPGMTDEKMAAAVSSLIEKREISAAGIDILEAKGKYGPVLEIFPDRGEKLAKRAGVGAPACYAIAYNGAEAVAHWDGLAFHLIRVDDIGKLN
jgi:hypothetical protein